MKVERIGTSEILPVTLEQFKKHLRLTSDDFDDNLVLLLKAAIVSAENFTGQVFWPGSFRLTGEFSARMKTGIMPITQIVSVSIDGEAKNAGVMVEDSELIFSDGITGGTVEVVFEAGFPELPFDVSAAILLIAGKLFENPSDAVEQLPKASTNLLRPYRRWGR